MKKVTGGKNIYGYDIGILMLETTFPRIIGDIGNALTWNFPVRYKIVKNQSSYHTVNSLTYEDLEPFILAAKELEKEGIKAITTSCGFLSLFQQELADAVNVPVYTSALLLVPLLSKMLGKRKKIGILTANKKKLSRKHLLSVGIDNIPYVVMGLEEEEVFTNFTVHNWESVDVEVCENELRKKARELLVQEPEIGAIVLECTNMCPYAKAVYEEAKVPVYDIVTLTNMVYQSINCRDYLFGHRGGV